MKKLNKRELLFSLQLEKYRLDRKKKNEKARFEAFKEVNKQKYLEASCTISLLIRPEGLQEFERIFMAVRRAQGKLVDNFHFTIELFDFNQALFRKTGEEIEATSTCESDFMAWCQDKSLPNYDFIDEPLPVSAFIGYKFPFEKED